MTANGSESQILPLQYYELNNSTKMTGTSSIDRK